MVAAWDVDVEMPMWAPPRIPSDETDGPIDPLDIYIPACVDYDTKPLNESQLPPVYVSPPPPTVAHNATASSSSAVNGGAVKRSHISKREREEKRRQSGVDASISGESATMSIIVGIDVISSVHQSMSGRTSGNLANILRNSSPMTAAHTASPVAPTAPHVPRTLFDSARTANKRAITPPPSHMETDTYEGNEWCVLEDVHMLHVLKEEQRMSYNMVSTALSHMPNWRFVSDEVSALMNAYRSARQCSIRYQLVVLPREEGRLVAYDPVTKKPRRCPLSELEMANMKKGRVSTMQQLHHDGQTIIVQRYIRRIAALIDARRVRVTCAQRRRGRRPASTATHTAHDRLMAAYGIGSHATPLFLADARQSKHVERRRLERAERVRQTNMQYELAAKAKQAEVDEKQRQLDQRVQQQQQQHQLQQQQQQQQQPSPAPQQQQHQPTTTITYDAQGPAQQPTSHHNMPTTARLLQQRGAGAPRPRPLPQQHQQIHQPSVVQVQQHQQHQQPQQPSVQHQQQPHAPVQQQHQPQQQQQQPSQSTVSQTVQQVVTQAQQYGNTDDVKPTPRVNAASPAIAAVVVSAGSPMQHAMASSSGSPSSSGLGQTQTTVLTPHRPRHIYHRQIVSTKTAPGQPMPVAPHNTTMYTARTAPPGQPQQAGGRAHHTIRPKVPATQQTFTRVVVSGDATTQQRSYFLQGTHPQTIQRVQQLRGASTSGGRRATLPKIHTIAQRAGGQQQILVQSSPSNRMRATLVRQPSIAGGPRPQSGGVGIPSISVMMPAVVRHDNTASVVTVRAPSGVPAQQRPLRMPAPRPPSNPSSGNNSNQ